MGVDVSSVLSHEPSPIWCTQKYCTFYSWLTPSTFRSFDRRGFYSPVFGMWPTSAGGGEGASVPKDFVLKT